MIKNIIVIFSLFSLSWGAQAQEEPAIAVVDFTTVRSTRYVSKLPELIIDRLVNAGYTVVEREKFRAMFKEIEAGQSGFLDPSTSSTIGQQSGARLLVTGKILSHTNSTKSGNVYGVNVKKSISTLQARMEVIDLDRGTKIFSKTAKAVSKSSSSGLADTGTATDIGDEVARKLVNAMLGSKTVKKAIKGKSGEVETVTITVKSSPESADVEVDGVFFGEAGNPLSISPGMHSIMVTYPGYVPWEKQVMVKDGMSFTARLGKEEKSE